MSNSKLVDYVHISPNSNNPRNHKIDTITIHHTAGVVSVETLGHIFAEPSRQASCNYGIGSDGRVALIVDEANRSWCSSSRDNDHRAITIEVSNCENGGDWRVSDEVLAKLIDLCVDICERNGISKLNFTGDTTGNLTMHKWFAATGCPGPYLESKFPYIADEVNKRLNATNPTETVIYRVQVGAFENKSNAENMLKNLKADGYDGFIVKATIPNTEVAKPTPTIKVGSVVRVKQGAKTYEGRNLASFVYPRDHVVKSIDNDRVVITFDGVVVAAVKLSDLTLVN